MAIDCGHTTSTTLHRTHEEAFRHAKSLLGADIKLLVKSKGNPFKTRLAGEPQVTNKIYNYGCFFSGKRKPRGKGQRNRPSKKTNCPWRANIHWDQHRRLWVLRQIGSHGTHDWRTYALQKQPQPPPPPPPPPPPVQQMYFEQPQPIVGSMGYLAAWPSMLATPMQTVPQAPVPLWGDPHSQGHSFGLSPDAYSYSIESDMWSNESTPSPHMSYSGFESIEGGNGNPFDIAEHSFVGNSGMNFGYYDPMASPMWFESP